MFSLAYKPKKLKSEVQNSSVEFVQQFLQKNLNGLLKSTLYTQILNYFQSEQFSNFIARELEQLKKKLIQRINKFVKKQVSQVTSLLKGFSNPSHNSKTKCSTSRNPLLSSNTHSINQQHTKKINRKGSKQRTLNSSLKESKESQGLGLGAQYFDQPMKDLDRGTLKRTKGEEEKELRKKRSEVRSSSKSERKMSPSGHSKTSSISQNKSENFNVFQNEELLTEDQIKEIAKQFLFAQHQYSDSKFEIEDFDDCLTEKSSDDN